MPPHPRKASCWSTTVAGMLQNEPATEPPASQVLDARPRQRRITRTWETGAEAQPSQWLGGHCSACAQCIEAKRAAAADEQLDMMTPLIHACLSGRADCVRALLEEPSVDVDFADPDGHTALHAASAFGHKDCVELLIQGGAKLDTPDNEGATPLDGARMSRTESATQCASLLVDAGCLLCRQSASAVSPGGRSRWSTK